MESDYSGRPGEFGDLGPFTTKQTTYLAVTDTPVYFYPVTLNGTLIGYLWASATANAAGYQFRPDADPIGRGADGWWRGKLQQSWERDVAPLDAIRRLVGTPEDPVGGGIAADAEEATLPNSRALLEFACRPIEGENLWAHLLTFRSRFGPGS